MDRGWPVFGQLSATVNTEVLQALRQLCLENLDTGSYWTRRLLESVRGPEVHVRHRLKEFAKCWTLTHGCKRGKPLAVFV